MLRESGSESNNLILGEGISYVGNPERTIDKYIEEAKHGKPIEFVVTTCPDYSYTYDSNKSEKAQYTFENVGIESGLVADRTVEKVLPIISNMEAEGVHNRLTFLYADTEAYDPDIQLAMGLDQQEFLCRINQSAQNLYRKLHSTYIKNGLTIYSSPSVDLMTQFIMSNALQRSYEIAETVKPSSIEGISIARNDLYTKWFQNHPKFKDKSLRTLQIFRAKKDVTDHIVLGESLRDLTKGIEGHPSTRSNIILITMSDDLLARFFNFSGAHPHVPVIQVSKSY